MKLNKFPPKLTIREREVLDEVPKVLSLFGRLYNQMTERPSPSWVNTESVSEAAKILENYQKQLEEYHSDEVIISEFVSTRIGECVNVLTTYPNKNLTTEGELIKILLASEHINFQIRRVLESRGTLIPDPAAEGEFMAELDLCFIPSTEETEET